MRHRASRLLSVFGINGSEFLLLALLAVVVIGPERLPHYAEQLGGLVRRGRGYLTTAKERVDSELGDEFGDVDWSKLDPRQYDPRKIVRDALTDDPAATVATAGATGAAAAGAAAAGRTGRESTTAANASAISSSDSSGMPSVAGETIPTPYDDEAT